MGAGSAYTAYNGTPGGNCTLQPQGRRPVSPTTAASRKSDRPFRVGQSRLVLMGVQPVGRVRPVWVSQPHVLRWPSWTEHRPSKVLQAHPPLMVSRAGPQAEFGQLAKDILHNLAYRLLGTTTASARAAARRSGWGPL